MENSAYGVIRVGKEEKAKFSKLASQLNRTQLDLGNQIIDYLVRNNIDPKKKDELLSATGDVKKLRETVVSFFRKQEKDMIKPLSKKVDEMHLALSETLMGLQPLVLQMQKKTNPSADAASENRKELLLKITTMEHNLKLIKNAVIASNNGKITLDLSQSEFDKLVKW